MKLLAAGPEILPAVSSLNAKGNIPAAAPDPEPQLDPLPWPLRYGLRQTPQPCTAPFANAPRAVLAIGIAPYFMSLCTRLD